MFYFPSLFRGNSFNAPATTDNKERNQSEEKTPPDTDYPEPLDPASLKKIAHMEDSKKLNLLKFKWKPEENFKFPSRNSRRYNPRWECDFPWLRYSKSEDSVYCGYCLVFAKSGCFSTSGYIDWKNAVGDKRGNFKKHEQCKQHQDAQQQATEFLRVCDSKERKDVYSFLSTEKIERNRKILLSIVDVIVTLGKRNIGLRGSWDKVKKKDDGNFQFFVDWKAVFDQDLKHHIEKGARNAQYISPKTQNELIACCEAEIRDSIIEKCKEAPFFSLCADETTDVSVTEQLPLCVRYIDQSTMEVCEDFLGYMRLEKCDAESISGVITETLQKWTLNIEKLRGLGFDGASVMSGANTEVQARLREIQPRATYVHCRSHQLNLLLVNSCQKVPAVRNLMDSVGRMTWFVTASAKQKAILKRCLSGDKEGLINQLVSEGEKVNNELLQQGLRRDLIPSLCSTRWPSRVDCLSALMVKYPAFYEILCETENESTGYARIEAAGHRRLLEDSSFIVSLVSSQYLLGFTRNLTDSLQESNCDLVKAFSDARNTRTVIISKRTNEDFEKIFERARIVAQSVDCSLEIPRQVARQQHRANAPATTPCEYWRINLFFPFIDHLMTQFDERFPESSRNMYLGYYLIPKYLPQLDDEKLKAIRESYQADLPQFHSLEQELLRWRNMTRKFDVNDKYPLQTALKIADKEFFPNLHAILSSILTLPVGSVCCERSFSSLRRLKTWERSTMGQERLCGLALLHIHKDKVDSTEGFNERVLKRWDATGHRKIGKLWNKEQENSE